MAYIYNDTENRLVLGNEEYVRQMGITGAHWTKLRISIRFVFQDTGSSVVSSSFLLGLCEGTTNTYRSANTTGYIGVGWYVNSTMTWSGGYYSNANNTLDIVRRVGNSTTNTSCSTNYTYWRYGSGCNLFEVDFVKVGGNNLFIGVAKPTNSGVGPAFSRYDFLYYLEMETTAPSTYETNYMAWTTGLATVAYNGNDLNALDTVSVSWNKSTPAIEVADIAVLRFA